LDATSSGIVAAALAIAVVVLIVTAVLLWRHVAALERRLASLTSAGDGTSLESTLHATLDRVGLLSTEVDQLRSRATVMEVVQRKAVQRTGLVRYNPFEDTGGNQSFAVALLDDHGDGVVVSSLHARQNTRVYAKAIAGGKSEAALSDEEAEALRKAMAPATPSARSS
jgi:HAMP domain-containing protein